jgi:hypothetical protein
MAGLFTPDPENLSYDEPDVFARVPAVGVGGNGLDQMQALAASAPGFNPSFRRPELPRGPDIYTNSAGQFYVQGMLFDEDDAQAALESERLLNQPGRGEPPPGGDWMAIDPQAYGEFLNTIKNPSLKRLAKKNFGIGVDNMQMLAGRGLQLAGAEQTGQNIVDAQMEDLRKTMPFQRQFTDIDSGRGAVEWLVANFAQQGPNLIESVATALAGYAAGTAVGGPLAGAGAALGGLASKTAWKQSVIAALKKKAAGEALDPMQEKLLREAAGLAGAVAASYAQNMTTGAADIYGEFRESGAGADDVSARMLSLAGSAPYALLETVPEYLLASRVLNPGGKITKGFWPAVGEYARRGGVGLTVGGTAEGFTEAGQEGLLLAANPDIDWDSPEGMNRLVNSFAAGFGVGGPIGGVANLRGPRNLLDPAKTTEPTSATVPITETPPPAPPATPYGPQPEPLTLQRDFGFEAPPPMVGPPGSLALPFGEPIGPEPLSPQQGLPFERPGDQMDLFGGPALPNAMPPLPGTDNMAPAAAPLANPAQGAFQFATLAPTGTQFQGTAVPDTAIAQQMQAAQAQQMQDAAYAQRQAELAAQQEQMRQRAFAQAEGQQQLDLVPPAPAPIDETLANMPMRNVGPTQPQQGNLFGNRGTPRPSATERLRRGIAPPQEAVPSNEELVAERDELLQERAVLERALTINGVPAFSRNKLAARRRIKAINERLQALPPVSPADTGQLGLFTSAGNPSLAALKGAGKRGPVRPVPAGTGVKQAPPTGKNVTREDIAKARAGAEEKAGPKRGLKKQAGVAKVEKANAVQERSPAKVDAREQAGTRQGMGGENAPDKAAGAGAKLRRNKAAQDTGEPDRKEAIVRENVKPPKEEPPVPKTEAAAAVSAAAAAPAAAAKTATSVKANQPIPISVELGDGNILRIPDGKAMLDKLDRDIEKFERFLACLMGK